MSFKKQKPIYEKHRDIGLIDKLEVFTTQGIAPHFHHQMEILCVSKGEILVQINDDERIIKKGDICVADSYDVHAYEILVPDTIAHVMIVPKSIIPDYCRATKNLVLEENFLIGSPHFDTIKKFITILEQNPSQNNLFKYGTVAAAMGLFYSAFKYKPHNFSDKSYAMRDVLQYIHENYNEELTLDFLSKKFGYSPNHFSTIFNFFTGKGLKDYINTIRVEHALEAILSGTVITEAAMMSGFESVRTFYRIFTKIYGQPPNSYLKKAAE